MIVFRNTDVDVAFFWSSDRQPPQRWHRVGDGPVQYTASTPSAAWAEFLRHAGITDPADLAGVERVMWTIDIDDTEPAAAPRLPDTVLRGAFDSYADCQEEAAKLRRRGATRLVAPSAAVEPGSASGWVCDPDLQPAGATDEFTIVLFGARPSIRGWICAQGRPEADLMDRVRHL